MILSSTKDNVATQVGDHDQDSLYDLTINQMERQPEAGNGNQVGRHPSIKFLDRRHPQITSIYTPQTPIKYIQTPNLSVPK